MPYIKKNHLTCNKKAPHIIVLLASDNLAPQEWHNIGSVDPNGNTNSAAPVLTLYSFNGGVQTGPNMQVRVLMNAGPQATCFCRFLHLYIGIFHTKSYANVRSSCLWLV
jgi:hypothetical protein